MTAGTALVLLELSNCDIDVHKCENWRTQAFMTIVKMTIKWLTPDGNSCYDDNYCIVCEEDLLILITDVVRPFVSGHVEITKMTG